MKIRLFPCLGSLLLLTAGCALEDSDPRAEKNAIPETTTSGAPSSAPADRIYIVRAGDTIGNVAHRLGVRASDLQKANNLYDGRIQVGQILVVPSCSITIDNEKQPGTKSASSTRKDSNRRSPDRILQFPSWVQSRDTLFDDYAPLQELKINGEELWSAKDRQAYYSSQSIEQLKCSTDLMKVRTLIQNESEFKRLVKSARSELKSAATRNLTENRLLRSARTIPGWKGEKCGTVKITETPPWSHTAVFVSRLLITGSLNDSAGIMNIAEIRCLKYLNGQTIDARIIKTVAFKPGDCKLDDVKASIAKFCSKALDHATVGLFESAERKLKLAKSDGAYKLAFDEMALAAERGYAPAQRELGKCYSRGKGVAKDDKKAVEWWRKAAEQGDAEAQFILGVCYAGAHKGIARDKKKAVEWFQKAADQGNPRSQYSLARCYIAGFGVTKDDKKAAELLQAGADQGDALSQATLGVLYRSGRGVPKDEKMAAKLYRMATEGFKKAAADGDTTAQYYLGLCYANGIGVSNDYKKAVVWFQKAAEQNHAGAQYYLGVNYYNGQGVPQDYAEAVKWYRKAAEQGLAQAQDSLGCCYYYGRGVPQDYTEAVKWYRKAAEQNNANAQYDLGCCYNNGYGVTKDYKKAIEWWRKAADQGFEAAKDALQSLQ